MKKIYLYLLPLLAWVTACEVNDLEPVNAISEDLAYTTPANIELSMAGVYDAAQSGFYGGSEANDRGYIWGAAHIQQGDMRGEDMVNINVFYGITYQATYTTATANNVNYWENGYRTINLANLFIDGVRGAAESGIISQEEANRYEGEARFLRAITYQEMLIHFARPYRDGNGSSLGLPIHEVGINSAETVAGALEIDRSSVAEVYEFLLADLDYAEQNLTESHPVNSVTRATKGAAIAFKTRAYLHMGQWDNVIEEGNKILSESAPFTSAVGGYGLTEGVRGPWDNNESIENIFSMEMSANDNTNTNAAVPNMYGSPELGARGEVSISPIIWNQPFWHADDLRRSALTTQNPGDGRYYTTKYTDYTNWTDYSPILRYAEVVLNVAEAEARAGDAARALALLNAVRDRAISGDMESLSGLSGAALTQAILNERRIEFLAEGQRWKDIHRNAVDAAFGPNGIPAKMLSGDVDADAYEIGKAPEIGIPAIGYNDHRFIWPIPVSEITTNPTLAEQQNPGY